MRMNPLGGLMKVNWNARGLRAFDYGLALGAIALGFFLDQQWLLWAGIIGLVFAVINPMSRIQRGIQSFFHSRD